VERNRLAEMFCVIALLIAVVWVGFKMYQTNQAPVVGESTEGNAGTGLTDPAPMFVPHSVQSTDRNAFSCPVTWKTADIGGGWSMNLGHFDKYIVAAELERNGHVWLYDYTPPGEYIEFIDTRNGNKIETPVLVRGSKGAWELGFHHRSIYKPNLEVFASYEVGDNSLKLASSSVSGDK
jgi:hypothetical protein